jgi:hypothetical protein
MAIIYDDGIAKEPHDLFVKAWHEHWQAHECIYAGSRCVFVDLLVDGSLPDETPESLIGKTVRVDYVHGFLWIGASPKVVLIPDVAETRRTDSSECSPPAGFADQNIMDHSDEG